MNLYWNFNFMCAYISKFDYHILTCYNQGCVAKEAPTFEIDSYLPCH